MTDKEARKALKEQYEGRHPDMGVVCWEDGENIWVDTSKDASASQNSTRFQLELGSWPNRELQTAFSDHPDRFEWKILKVLDYEERADVKEEDLDLLLLMVMDEYPKAKMMKPGKKLAR